MTGLLIAAAVIILIALLRFGASAEYSDEGIAVSAQIGFLRLQILPPRPKTKLRPKKAKRGAKKARPERSKRPGSALDAKKLLEEALKLLSKVRRRLLIRELTVIYVQAGGEPHKMAMRHGLLQSALGVTQAGLETFFRIKRYSLHTSVDFIASEPSVYFKASLSIAVWEAVYLGLKGLGLMLRSRNPRDSGKNERIAAAAGTNTHKMKGS